MSFEKSWGESRHEDTQFGEVLEPTGAQRAAADKILEGGELEHATIDGEEEEPTYPHWPPKN